MINSSKTNDCSYGSIYSLRGIYLDEDSIKNILKGFKKIIISSKSYPRSYNSYVIISNGIAYGIATIYKKEFIRRDEFNRLKTLHCVSREKQLKQFKNYRKFYAYYFNFEEFDKYKKVEINEKNNLFSSIKWII